MLPEQVQFCYAASQGNGPLARKLAPKVKILPQNDVFKENDFQYSPAIFCLWLLEQADPQIAKDTLQQHFPQEPVPQQSANPESFASLIREIVYPLVREYLLPFLHNIASLAGSLATRRDDKQNFFITSSTDALQRILKEKQDFALAPNSNREQITQRIFDKLKPYADQLRFETCLTTQTMKDTMSRLHRLFSAQGTTVEGDVEDIAQDLSNLSLKSRSYFPSARSHPNAKEAKVYLAPRTMTYSEPLETLTSRLANVSLSCHPDTKTSPDDNGGIKKFFRPRFH